MFHTHSNHNLSQFTASADWFSLRYNVNWHDKLVRNVQILLLDYNDSIYDSVLHGTSDDFRSHDWHFALNTRYSALKRECNQFRTVSAIFFFQLRCELDESVFLHNKYCATVSYSICFCSQWHFIRRSLCLCLFHSRHAISNGKQ